MTIIDLIKHSHEPAPQMNYKIKCLHLFDTSKRAWVTPLKVENLHNCVFQSGTSIKDIILLLNLRNTSKDSLKTLREDHKRSLNPTPYRVALSKQLFNTFHHIRLKTELIGELF